MKPTPIKPEFWH